MGKDKCVLAKIAILSIGLHLIAIFGERYGRFRGQSINTKNVPISKAGIVLLIKALLIKKNYLHASKFVKRLHSFLSNTFCKIVKGVYILRVDADFEYNTHSLRNYYPFFLLS